MHARCGAWCCSTASTLPFIAQARTSPPNWPAYLLKRCIWCLAVHNCELAEDAKLLTCVGKVPSHLAPWTGRNLCNLTAPVQHTAHWKSSGRNRRFLVEASDSSLLRQPARRGAFHQQAHHLCPPGVGHKGENVSLCKEASINDCAVGRSAVGAHRCKLHIPAVTGGGILFQRPLQRLLPGCCRCHLGDAALHATMEFVVIEWT